MTLPREPEAASLTAQGTACPALPPGTDTTSVGAWETWNGVTRRLCWSHPIPLPDRLQRYDVRAVVQQLPDGSTVHEPSVCIGEYEFSVLAARRIVQALAAAADVGEQMATRWALSDDELLPS